MSPSRFHQGELKTALIQETAKLIEDKGIDHLSLRRLAGILNVNPSALYSHFESKDALLSEVARHGFKQLLQQMKKRLDPSLAAFERLRGLSHALIDFVHAHPELFKLMFSPLFADLQRKDASISLDSRETFQIFETQISATLSEQNSTTDLTTASLFVWSFVHGLCHLIIGNKLNDTTIRKLKEGNLLDQLVNTINCGLAPRD